MVMSQKMKETDGYQVRESIPTLPTTLSDHPSLVGIIRLPFCSVIDDDVEISLPLYHNNLWQMVTQKVQFANEIKQITVEDSSFTVSKNKITDVFPYTYYVLTDGECEPLILKPQYMPTECYIKGKYALSNQPVERYYIEGYKGDYTGNVYNITNLNQMMLPCANNEGINYMNANANTIMQNRKNVISSNILGGVTSTIASVGSALTGNVMATLGTGMYSASNTINGLNQIKEIDARNKDLMLVPNTIASFGTPSTRNAFECNNVRVLKYTIKDNVKSKIENFVNRYGNKFNSYDSINLTNYKGYIKFIAPNIDGKIDNIYMSKIISILERGIYIE